MRPSRRLLSVLVITASVVLLLPLSATAAPGDLDTTFSGDGMQTTDLTAGTDDGYTVVTLSGGRSLVLASTNSYTDLALVQYTNRGEPDPAFGGGDGSVGFQLLGSESAFNALGVLAGGKIVVAAATKGSGRRKLAMYRFTPPGLPDPTYGGGDGKLAIAFAHDFYAYDLVVLPNGKILVSGEEYLTDPDSEFLVARLMPNGSLDHSFGGGDGFVVTRFGSHNDGAWRMALDAHRRIVVAGWAGQPDGTYDVALARYSPNGVLDPTFGGDGKVRLQVLQGADDYVVGMAISGNKIVTAIQIEPGSVTGIALARFLADGSLDQTFGGGDGEALQVAGANRSPTDLALDSSGRILVLARDAASTECAVERFLPSGRIDGSFGDNGMALTDFAPAGPCRGMALSGIGKIVTAGGTAAGVAVARFLP